MPCKVTRLNAKQVEQYFEVYRLYGVYLLFSILFSKQLQKCKFIAWAWVCQMLLEIMQPTFDIKWHFTSKVLQQCYVKRK